LFLLRIFENCLKQVTSARFGASIPQRARTGHIARQLLQLRLSGGEIPASHPLRPIRQLVDEALGRLSTRFARLYARQGRPSVPPEKLLRALLMMVLYSVRSERRLIEELHYNLLYRWFVGWGMNETVWDATTFSKNRDRFIDGEVARRFFDEVLALAETGKLLSQDHFSVDGTLIEAWASLKSFRQKDSHGEPSSEDPGNPSVNFHGERRSNQTHESTSDPMRGWRERATARNPNCAIAAMW
jgi:transposase